MSLTCGYFDHENHDRYYNANEINEFLNGQMTYGVYKKVYSDNGHRLIDGTSLKVEEGTWDEDFHVAVRPGKGWYDNIWIINDEDLILTSDRPENMTARYDYIYVEINKNVGIRKADIKIIKGSPVPLSNSNTVNIRINVSTGITTKNLPEELVPPELPSDNFMTSYPLALLLIMHGNIQMINPGTSMPNGPITATYYTEIEDKRKFVSNLMDFKNFKVMNNVRTTEPGSGLDARMGYYLGHEKAPFSFGIDSRGRYGFIKDGTDTVIPF